MRLIPLLMALGVVDPHGRFVALYTKYNGPLYAFIYKMVQDEEEAMDLVQDSFARLLNSGKQLDDETRFRNYLYTIAVNLVRDRGRRSKLRQHASFEAIAESGVQLEDPNSRPDTNIERENVEQTVQQLIDELPETDRTMLLMKKVEGMTYEDISRITGRSVRTAKRTVKAALDRLVDLMEDRGLLAKGATL